MSGNYLSCSKGVKDPLEVHRLVMISLETPQWKWASSRMDGRISWIFSSFGKCSRLTMGGPALVASGKASPHASCSGPSRDSSPFVAGA